VNPSPHPADAYLKVRALDRDFAVPANRARAVFAISTLTEVAGAPARIVGLTNYRGAVVAVFCLARRLDARARPAGVGASAIAIEWGAETFALAVESVDDIAPADAIHLLGPLGPAPVPILDLGDLFDAPALAEAGDIFNAQRKPSDPGDPP
jgi:hypothetical protein